MKHTLILPDGRSISSGTSGPAICSVKLTEQVNPEEYLTPGGVGASRLEIALFDPEGLPFSAGDRVTLQGVGVFTLEEPARRGKHLTLTGYDCLKALDADLTPWLEGLEGWPYRLKDFAAMVCHACGITLEDREIPNGDYEIAPFRGVNITGRQLMKWAAEAAGRFLRATGEASAALCWYEDRGTAIEKTGNCFYYQGSLTLGQPRRAPDCLVLRRTESDIGIASGEGENPLYITGNYLLTEADQAVAAAILAQLQLPYTPCSFETPVAVAPGEMLQIAGHATLAMAVEKTGSRYRVRCFDAPAAESRVKSRYQALAGRTMELTLGLEGIQAQVSQVRATAETAAQLSLTVDALESRVSASESSDQQQTQWATSLTQRADSLELSVLRNTAALTGKAEASQVQEMAVHFRFGAEGLTISDTATGMGLAVSQSQVAFTGGADPTTVITPNAMVTTNLSVDNRLTLGTFTLLPRTNGNLSLRYIGA